MNFFEKSTCQNGRFVAYPNHIWKGFWDVVKWKWKAQAKPWPKWRDLSALPSVEHSSTQQVSASWINHSTVLMKVGGVTILTDPVFSHRVGPLPWLGVKRTTPPSQSIESLPPIDIILISHNHYDHLDAYSLRTILSLNDALVIAPLGHKSLLKSLGCNRVVELDWWDSHRFSPSLNIHLTPALHWSRRSLWDTCRALWGGFIIEDKACKIFFAGDTGYHSHFQMICDRFGPMDLSFLPIGAYEPRWFMKEFHMNPSDAVQAHIDLCSKLSVGIHFGTFRLTDEGIDDPIYDLKHSLIKAQITPENFIVPLQGQAIIA